MKPKLLLLMFLLTLNLLVGRSANGQTGNVATPPISEGPCIVVSGAVSKPARVVLTKPIRLAELIASVGGPTEKAGDMVQILHSVMNDCSQQPPAEPACEATVSFNLYNLAEMKNGDSYNPVIHPGDVVIVQAAPVAYVVGNVLRPQGIYFRKQLTVTQAIALAGGSLPGSELTRVRVIRQQPASQSTTEIVVDLKQVKKGVADVTLQPYDIVEVPGKRSGLLCVLRIGPVTIPAISYAASDFK
ncbi:MAG TPA: SLBB domain-containing protein [Pyrinomonadaceae bacterium]|jgi:polysaccharide export outer membrane protein|nr:SLBB domain-containing protein [Pyrinomonadaceae bacterium]